VHRFNIVQKARDAADEIVGVSGFERKAAESRVGVEQVSEAKPSLGIQVPKIV
jgi:hypothetical protein